MKSSPTPILGVHLLETITRGMYSEPLHCIREYIQNAYDSIRKARRDELISPDEGRILLVIDPINRTLRVRDNGTGLSPEEAAVYLLDIGNSDKARTIATSSQNVGFRGIGRMAGISYCKTLRFETSNGNGSKCVVEFDATGINHLTRRGQASATIVEAIRQNSQIEELSEKKGSHYLEVTLDGVEAQSAFLDPTRLEEYIAQVAPVPHDPSVWSFADKINSFAEKVKSISSLDHISIHICDPDENIQTDIRRPFRNIFRTANARGKNFRTVKVEDVILLPRDGAPIDGWWGWLAKHEYQGALADIPFAGLRIRMHNIAIGNENIIRELFTTKNLAMWCFGEIHITNSELMPNAQRDHFESSKVWSRIRERLKDEVIQIEKEVRSESAKRNTSPRTIIKRAQKTITDAEETVAIGFASHNEKENIIHKLEQESEKVKKQQSKKSCTDAEKKNLDETIGHLKDIITRVRSIRRTGADSAQAHLNKQARKAVRTVLNVLKVELDEKVFRRIEPKINAALQPGKKD